MKSKFIFGILLTLILVLLIAIQIYRNTKLNVIKGVIVSIENDSYNLDIDIKSEDKIQNFTIENDTLIYKKNNAQTNFNCLKINKQVQIKYKPILFDKNKAVTVNIIN